MKLTKGKKEYRFEETVTTETSTSNVYLRLGFPTYTEEQKILMEQELSKVTDQKQKEEIKNKLKQYEEEKKREVVLAGITFFTICLTAVVYGKNHENYETESYIEKNKEKMEQLIMEEKQ